jgi:hypothetical protein
VFPDLLVLGFGLKSGSVECISMARRTHFCEDLISEQDALNDENVAETLDGCFLRDAHVNLVPQEIPQENPHESPHGPRKTFSIFLGISSKASKEKLQKSLSVLGTNCLLAGHQLVPVVK